MSDSALAGIAPLRTGPLILVVDDDQPDRIAATRMVREYATRIYPSPT